MTKQQIADEMTRLMLDPASDAKTLDEIKRAAIANLKTQ